MASRLDVDRPGLVSRETDEDPCGLGPTVKWPWCFECALTDSSEWLRDDSLVATPEEPGRESPRVVEGDVTGGET